MMSSWSEVIFRGLGFLLWIKFTSILLPHFLTGKLQPYFNICGLIQLFVIKEQGSPSCYFITWFQKGGVLPVGLIYMIIVEMKTLFICFSSALLARTKKNHKEPQHLMVHPPYIMHEQQPATTNNTITVIQHEDFMGKWLTHAAKSFFVVNCKCSVVWHLYV